MWHRNVVALAMWLGLSLGLWAQATTPASPLQTPSAGSTEARPQTGTNTPSDIPVLRTYTRMVVVDVIATDAKGNPIHDLKAEDLKVFEDGKEQTIKAFSFHEPNIGTAPQKPKLGYHEVTNIPLYNATSSFNVIILDTLNTVFTDQAYAREEVIKFVQKLPNDQPVAIFGLNSKRLQLLQDFTTDPELLKKAIHGMKGELSPLLMNPTGIPGSRGAGQFAHLEAQLAADRTNSRMQATMAVFSALGQVLENYHGRKNVIWLTDGIPVGGFSLMGRFDYMEDYGSAVGKAAESLRSAQIAIYPIDAHGLAAPSFFDAGNRSGGSLQQSLQRDFVRSNSIHAAMNDLAERTGGRAFYNRNDLDNLVAKSIEDGSTYYTIGYYPENKNWNGRFRKIKVTAQPSSAKLRYRIGYYAADPGSQDRDRQAQVGDDLLKALNIDFPASTGLPFRAAITPPSPATQNKVVVNFAIQADALRFVDQNDGLHHATVECGVRAFSAKGVPMKAAVQTVEASLKPETFNNVMQSAFPCRQEIDLPAGSFTLRLAVHDSRTGLTGSTNAQVTIAKK